MNTKFRRSLVGYAPTSVTDKISSLRLDMEKKLSLLEKELEDAENENNKIRQTIEELKNDIKSFKNIEEQIAKRLLDAHMDSVKSIYMTRKQLEKTEKEKQDDVLLHKKRNDGYKKVLKKLLAELHSEVEEYREKIESYGFKGEG